MKTRTTVYLSRTIIEDENSAEGILPTTIGPKSLWRCDRADRSGGMLRAVYSAANEELTPAQREAAKLFVNHPVDWVEPATPLKEEDEPPKTDMGTSNYTEEDGNRLLRLRRESGIK